jgi:hypothetical protein
VVSATSPKQNIATMFHSGQGNESATLCNTVMRGGRNHCAMRNELMLLLFHDADTQQSTTQMDTDARTKGILNYTDYTTKS